MMPSTIVILCIQINLKLHNTLKLHIIEYRYFALLTNILSISNLVFNICNNV